MVVSERGEFVYAPPTTIREEIITLSTEEAHHLYRVRRVSPGATVFATTGSGSVYECLAAGDRTLRIVRHLPEFGEPPVHLTLCMAMLKGDGNREVVDIATQLGARSIIFFRAEHSEGRLLADKLVKLRLNAITTIKQCGRAWLPTIRVALNLTAALSHAPAGSSVLVAHPSTEVNARVAPLVKMKSAALIVGPEGGLTAHELEIAAENRALQLQLGNRRLRSEAAVAAGLSCLLNAAGEFGTRG